MKVAKEGTPFQGRQDRQAEIATVTVEKERCERSGQRTTVVVWYDWGTNFPRRDCDGPRGQTGSRGDNDKERVVKVQRRRETSEG